MEVPPPDPVPVHAHAPESSMSISIADNVVRVAGGDAVRYEVTVTNSADVERPVTVRLTLSSGTVTDLQADNAAVLANAVAWKHTLAPGASRTYTVAGVVETQRSSSDLAATACVHLAADAPALTCVTDLNAVASSSSTRSGERRLAWIAAILLGFLAVIGAVWLHRRVNPEPLTPAAPDSPGGDRPGQPGGAPSV